MIMVSIALVMAVIVTNIFMRKDTDSVMPNYLRCVFLRNRSRIEKLHWQLTRRMRASSPTSTSAPENKDSATIRRRYVISESPDKKDLQENKMTEMATVSSHLNDLAELNDQTREVDLDSLSMLSRLGSFKNGVDGSGNRRSVDDKSRERTLSNSDDAGAGPWTLAAQVAPLTTTSFIGLRRSKRLSDSNRPFGTGATAVTALRADGTSGAAYGDGAVELTAEQIKTQIEWQELARVVDRLFFWVFMLSSIGILAVLTYSIIER